MLFFRKTVSVLTAALMTASAVYVSAADIDITQTKTGDGFRYVVENDEIVITGYANTREPQTVIPEEIDGMPVTRIHYLFGNITEITVPDSVKTIDDKAFKGNFILSKAVIPESVTELGTNVFSDCAKLVSCELNASVKEIPVGIFSGCSMLSDITLPEDIEYIGGGAFSGCASLKNIDIPETMTEIPSALFRGCSSLESIELPEGIKKIGNSAFYDCSSLTVINIPESVEEIGEYAFSGCSSVTELSIPNVRIINDGLFRNCTSLKKAELAQTGANYTENNTTRVFGRDLFRNCSSLKEVILPYGLHDIGENCFDGCTLLESVTIPDTVRIIDSYAFRNCSSLKEINIPEFSVVYGNETFAGCSSLEDLVIPDTVFAFAQGGADKATFKGCSSLKTLYVPEKSSFSVTSFDGCDSLTDIYIGTMYGSCMKDHLGYIYDPQTDSYNKNEKLTIYCREGSAVQKYAQQYGLNYEITEGTDSYLAYFAVYDDPEDIMESVAYRDSSDTEKFFINGRGQFRVSRDYVTFTNEGYTIDHLKNNLVLAVDLGFDTETFSYVSAAPSLLNFDGTDLSEVYDEIIYDTMVMDDGYWYLFIECSSSDGSVTEENIKGRKMNVGFVIEDFYIRGEEPEYLTGDANGDGTVNAADLAALKMYLLNCPGAETDRLASDINQDGTIDVVDLILLKNYLLNS